MKKHQSKKLELTRETIQPLTSQELEGAAGGATPALLLASTVGISVIVAVTKR